MHVVAETELIERAKRGDRDAFAELYAPVERPLAAFLYRLVAERGDAEDLAQETAVAALEKIAEFPAASSFRIWIFRIAVEAALNHLRGEKQWDPDALIRAGESSTVLRKLQQIHGSALHTTYNIPEHIDFCFACMGRTLPPQEQATLLLSEVHRFTPEETAETLGISAPVLRFRLQQARESLVEHYDSRCSLINKDGSCKQCVGLDTLLHGDRRHTEQALFQIDLEQRATVRERAGSFDARLAIVRDIDPLHGEGAKLHDSLMNFTREVNGY